MREKKKNSPSPWVGGSDLAVLACGDHEPDKLAGLVDGRHGHGHGMLMTTAAFIFLSSFFFFFFFFRASSLGAV